MFYDEDKNSFNESIESLKEEASESGWHCDVRVPNGSDWDFCPRCYKAYIEERTGK